MERYGRYRRTINLIGEEAQEKLIGSKVAIFGVGGVGSYVAEAIARSGIGSITLIDGDVVVESNINRQLIALSTNIGMPKAIAEAERIRAINPDADVLAINEFYKVGSDFDLSDYDYVIDAIDDVNAKVELIRNCVEKGIPVVSSMGAGGKFDTAFRIADISKTSVCPLAKVMRKRLREIGIEHLPVAFSEVKPVKCEGELGTMSYVPGACGLVIAGYVIRSLAGIEK